MCADPECETHGKPNYCAEQEAAAHQREVDWKRQQQQREKNRENNRHLFDRVLGKIPKTLTRDDFEMLVFAAIERLDFEDWDAICEGHNIETDDIQEPDAAADELRKKAQAATKPQLLHMLVELALLPSGYSDELLEHTDLLASAARRYKVSLNPEKAVKAKCAETQGSESDAQDR